MRLLFWLSLALLAGPGAKSVWAHEWFPVECCSDRDCARIDASAVRVVAGGYHVTVRPGSHPMVPAGSEPRSYTIPFREAKPSQDAFFNICIAPDGRLLCFFHVIGGV
ncbi:hypothetical protein [Devosia sp.]|uniref:hypothetical protein n=1 Tax=Devosia sp. TaxID=1871048 RepID=UPI002FC7D295